MSVTLVSLSFQTSVVPFPKSTLQMSPGNDLFSSHSLSDFIAIFVSYFIDLPCQLPRGWATAAAAGLCLHSHAVQVTTKQTALSDERGLPRAGWSVAEGKLKTV